MPKRGRYAPANLIASDNLRTQRGIAVVLPDISLDPAAQAEWLRKLTAPHTPRVIDLFCGAGGMSEGFVNAGFVVVRALDHDQMACNTYAANIPAKVSCTDIEKIVDPLSIIEGIDVPSIDVIIGGPPCQGFSQVGKARIRSLAEENQGRLLARNELYQHFFSFVEAFKPLMFVMENVVNLETFEKGAYMEAIKLECERLGYDLEYDKLNAVDYGVPQNRRRLFIVGSRIGRLFRWPRVIHEQDPVTLEQAIGDLPSVQPPSLEERLPYYPEKPVSAYQRLMRSRVFPEEREYIYDHIVRPVRLDDIEIFSNMKPGDRYSDIPREYQRYNPDSFKDKYYMLRPDAPSVTITAHLSRDGYRYIHYDTSQHRTISVREAARIQSFADHFRFAGFRSSQFKQIGNAVPPMMAEAVATQVKLAIRRGSKAFKGDIIQFGIPGIKRHKLVDASE